MNILLNKCVKYINCNNGCIKKYVRFFLYKIDKKFKWTEMDAKVCTYIFIAISTAGSRGI